MKKLLLILLCLTMLLAACDTISNPAPSVNLPTQPAPEAGKATVVGQILDVETGEPLVDAVVRLAEVNREVEGGIFVLNFAFSPGARTDANGIYIMTNIEPGEYVISVGDGDNFNEYDVIEDPNTGNARVWNAPPDQVSYWETTKAQVLYR